MPSPPLTMQQALEQAISHLQQGRIAPAATLLQQVLAQQPQQGDALHYLGVIALQQGKLQEAHDLIQRSLQVAPGFAAFNNLGHVFRAAGRLDDALACFDRAAQLEPNHPDAFSNLATMLVAAGKHDLAARALQRLVQIQPEHPRAHMLLGVSLAELRYFERAVTAFNDHLKIDPNDAECFGRRSVAMITLNRVADAIASATKALDLAPQRAEAHNNMGWILDRAGRLAEAEPHYRRAIDLDPTFVLAIGNLASILERTDRFDESLATFERAAAADPKHVDAQCSLAGSYSKAGRYAQALAAAGRALAAKPHDPAARGHRSLCLLAFGNYEEGFAEYEWRWQCKDFTTPEREFTQPRYVGGDATGRTVLIHSEQGYGDNIQFARYLPLLADRGATVFYECPVSLRRLMETVPGVSRVIPGGLRAPPFELQAPLLSLPHAFKTSLATVPRNVPYFNLPDSHVAAWREKLASRFGRFNVGLLWRGNAKPNPKRSIPLAQLAPLARDGVTFFSLQVGAQASEAAAAPAGMNLVDPSSEVTDFYDLAGVIANLDLVITIDSGPAHLSGALGKPTWTLLIKAADWRWLQDRDDSPWYPSMKLYRQSQNDVWDDVIARVADDLHAIVR